MSVIKEKSDRTESFVGIDIGSRTSKAVLLCDDNIFKSLIFTDVNMQSCANELLNKLLYESGLERESIKNIVATGYGRISLSFGVQSVSAMTEITCHAKGAYYLNTGIKTIIDIGGQDSKIIKLNPKSGKVEEFVMNDKCAAGTGKFLEKAAEILELDLDGFGNSSVKAENPCFISNQCIVFAESEVISLQASGETKENIAAGIHAASSLRIRNLYKKLGCESPVLFSGGVSNNNGMRKSLEDNLEITFSNIEFDTTFTGALGAALYAKELFKKDDEDILKEKTDNIDLNTLSNLIDSKEKRFVSGEEKLLKSGYLCTYTPLEIFDAADVSYLRIYKAGDSNTVSAGEELTQSVFCDKTKSILGAFKRNLPLYNAFDKVYSFFTCDCIKKVAEAIYELFKEGGIYILPRQRERRDSLDFYITELKNFKKDIEKVSCVKITDEMLLEKIREYNAIRKILKNISSLRKKTDPVITGGDFLELMRGYFYLSPGEYRTYLDEQYKKLLALPESNNSRIRLMIAGGVIADGDKKILKIVEEDLGARIVCEDHCSGVKAAYNMIREDEFPLEAIAEGYFGKAPCSRMKPLSDSINFSGELAQEYNVDGALYVYLKFCPCYGQIKNEFLSHYQKLGIPVLELSTDYSKNDIGQLKTRIEAFIEVLKERKK